MPSGDDLQETRSDHRHNRARGEFRPRHSAAEDVAYDVDFLYRPSTNFVQSWLPTIRVLDAGPDESILDLASGRGIVLPGVDDEDAGRAAHDAPTIASTLGENRRYW